MKVGFFGVLVLVICCCTKKKTEPYSSLQNTKWNWISTTQDSTFYEDTASSSNSQFLHFMDYKNMEWKRNDSVFFNGVFRTGTKVSALTGNYQLIMELDGAPMEYMIVQLNDTLWLREDVATGSRTFRYFKTN